MHCKFVRRKNEIACIFFIELQLLFLIFLEKIRFSQVVATGQDI